MSGNRLGGLKTAKINKAKYGDDFYVRVGRSGGIKSAKKGFALMSPEKRKAAGSKGGSISRRGVAIYGRDENGKALTKNQYLSRIKNATNES